MIETKLIESHAIAKALRDDVAAAATALTPIGQPGLAVAIIAIHALS